MLVPPTWFVRIVWVLTSRNGAVVARLAHNQKVGSSNLSSATMDDKYILGSHNSWSYLPAKSWWMKPFAFMARCQNISIVDQYEMGVRCFDLRIQCKNGHLTVGHGFMTYDYSYDDLMNDLTFLNSKGDCYVRVLHEVRNRSGWKRNTTWFKTKCAVLEYTFQNIKFWCGKNLYTWETDFKFGNNPSCEEKYSSVCAPKLIDDWWPYLFAKRNNKSIKKKGTEKDILLIDYVNL